MKQDYAASLLKKFQSSVEYQSTDRVVTRAQFHAFALQVVEPSSVTAVEQELMRQGRLAYRVARNGLEVGSMLYFTSLHLHVRQDESNCTWYISDCQVHFSWG